MLFSLYFWPVVESLIPIQGNLSPFQKKRRETNKQHQNKERRWLIGIPLLYRARKARHGNHLEFHPSSPPKNYLPLVKDLCWLSPERKAGLFLGRGTLRGQWVVGWPAMSHEGDVSKQDALMPCVCSFDSTSKGELLGPIHVNYRVSCELFTGRGRFFLRHFIAKPKDVIENSREFWLQIAFW